MRFLALCWFTCYLVLPITSFSSRNIEKMRVDPNLLSLRISGDGERISVDVADLGLTLDDLTRPLDEVQAEICSRNSFSEWAETLDAIDIRMRHEGMRGQPCDAVKVDLTPTTITVSIFGYAVWSGVIKGPIVLDQSYWEVEEGLDRIPTITLHLSKGYRELWGETWLEAIGVDGVLQ